MALTPENSLLLDFKKTDLEYLMYWGRVLQDYQQEGRIPQFVDSQESSFKMLEARQMYEVEFGRFITYLILEERYTQLATASILTLNRFDDELLSDISETETRYATLEGVLELIAQEEPENDRELITEIKYGIQRANELSHILELSGRRYHTRVEKIKKSAALAGEEPRIPKPPEPMVDHPIRTWSLSHPQGKDRKRKLLFRVDPPDYVGQPGDWQPGSYPIEEIEQWIAGRVDPEDELSPLSLINKKQPDRSLDYEPKDFA